MEGPRDDRRRLDSFDSRGGNSSRQLLRENATEILERISEDFFAVDRKWRFTYLNRRALRRVQLAIGEYTSREELIGRNVWEVFPEQVGSVFHQKYHQAMQEQETVEFEAYLPLTGEWHEVHAYPSTEGLSIYSRVITARKHAEEEVRKSEERFRTQYESFPIPTFSWRRVEDDFELVDYNEAAAEITRGGLVGLLGVKASEWYAERPRILEMLSRCRNERVAVQDEIAWQMRTTGEHKHFAVTFVYVSPDLVVHYAEDITDRKRAEDAWEEYSVLLSSIVEGAPDPIFLKDTQGRYLLANSAAAEVMGRSVEDVLGKNNAELVPPETAKRIMAVDRRVIETGESQTGEEIMTVQGVDRTFLFNKAPYRDHRGEVAGVIGIGRDITERKRAEERLQEAEKRYRSIFENAAEGIFQSTLDGRLLTANPALARIAGYESPEEFIASVTDVGQQIYASPEERVEFVSRMRLHGVVVDYEHQGRRKDGSLTWVSTSARAVRGTNGDLIGFEGRVMDITERKQAEEALVQAKERFHSLVLHSSDINTILAADGTVVYQSPALERILGYKPEELIGKDVFKYVHPEDLEQVLNEFENLLDNPGTHLMVTFRFRHKEGSWRYLEATGSNLLHDPGIEGLVFNSRDVTERRNLYENQQRFLANAAHQLKTPITTIVGAAELLVTKKNLRADKKGQLLDHIFSESHRLQRLSDTLLRAAKAGRDRQEPELEAVDLTEAARHAAARMAPLAEGSGLSLRVEGDGTRALADPEWLQEVLLIVLGNAAKHSSSAREIRVRARQTAITVEDEGTGIGSDDLPHVFERFYRGDGGTEGFGLGLSIGRELVERMGGTITIDSTEGKGTRVRIELRNAGVDA
jgi:PAS domain S-box-containing protein